MKEVTDPSHAVWEKLWNKLYNKITASIKNDQHIIKHALFEELSKEFELKLKPQKSKNNIAEIIKTDIENILYKYLFESNSKETRKNICDDVWNYFKTIDVNFFPEYITNLKFVDVTNDMEVDKGTIAFGVQINNEDTISLQEFINIIKEYNKR